MEFFVGQLVDWNYPLIEHHKRNFVSFYGPGPLLIVRVKRVSGRARRNLKNLYWLTVANGKPIEGEFADFWFVPLPS